MQGGMNFDNILDDDNGTVVACMQYYPVVDPLNPSSDSVKVQFTRLTGRFHTISELFILSLYQFMAVAACKLPRAKSWSL